MIFKVFGLKIKVTFLFAAIICLMLFMDKTGLAIPLLVAVFSHEVAHILAMKILRCAPSEIELIPGSIKIINPQRYDRKKENIILLCGPFCNLILFCFFYLLYAACGYYPLVIFAAVELIIGAFNLLPARGLDGGSLLNNLLLKCFSPTKAALIYLCVSVFTGTFFLALGILSAVFGVINPSMIILGLYIIILNFTNKC